MAVPLTRPLFVGHGSPNMAIQPLHPMNILLGSTLPSQFESQPKAVVIFSAHWEESFEKGGVAISFHNSNTEYTTLHDFVGFSALQKLRYPAKGSPEVATRIEE